MPSSVAKRTVASEFPVETAMVVDARHLDQVAVRSKLGSRLDPRKRRCKQQRCRPTHPRFTSAPSASSDRISAASGRVQVFDKQWLVGKEKNVY